MSHWIKAKIQVTDREHLLAALAALGGHFEENGEITALGQKLHVGIKMSNSLGMNQLQDGTWQLEGDPYYSTDSFYKKYYGKEKQLLQEIGVKYTVSKVKKDLSLAGFHFEENEAGEINTSDGQVHMVATTWN